MSNIERFDLVDYTSCGTTATRMESTAEGDWIRFEDYEKLRADLEVVRLERDGAVQYRDCISNLLANISDTLRVRGITANQPLDVRVIALAKRADEADQIKADLAAATSTSEERLKCIDVLLLKCRNKDNDLAAARERVEVLRVALNQCRELHSGWQTCDPEVVNPDWYMEQVGRVVDTVLATEPTPEQEESK